jgi:hypothetical protein
MTTFRCEEEPVGSSESRGFRFLVIAVAVLIAVLAANALIDFGALLHDLTHAH